MPRHHNRGGHFLLVVAVLSVLAAHTYAAQDAWACHVSKLGLERNNSKLKGQVDACNIALNTCKVTLETCKDAGKNCTTRRQEEGAVRQSLLRTCSATEFRNDVPRVLFMPIVAPRTYYVYLRLRLWWYGARDAQTAGCSSRVAEEVAEKFNLDKSGDTGGWDTVRLLGHPLLPWKMFSTILVISEYNAGLVAFSVFLTFASLGADCTIFVLTVVMALSADGFRVGFSGLLGNFLTVLFMCSSWGMTLMQLASNLGMYLLCWATVGAVWAIRWMLHAPGRLFDCLLALVGVEANVAGYSSLFVVAVLSVVITVPAARSTPTPDCGTRVALVVAVCICIPLVALTLSCLWGIATVLGDLAGDETLLSYYAMFTTGLGLWVMSLVGWFGVLVRALWAACCTGRSGSSSNRLKSA